MLGHTAEVALRAEGRTQGELFMNAARGLRALCGLRAGRRGRPEPVRLSADSPEALLVAWLEELVFRLSARSQTLSGVRWMAMEPGRLEARAFFRTLARGERPRLEVKAATYHGLKVARRGGWWTASVILDV